MINTRTTLTIPRDLKSQLEIIAKNDHKSLNNLIINILYNYIDDTAYCLDKKKSNFYLLLFFIH